MADDLTTLAQMLAVLLTEEFRSVESDSQWRGFTVELAVNPDGAGSFAVRDTRDDRVFFVMVITA
jgi:hypothetical protein